MQWPWHPGLNCSQNHWWNPCKDVSSSRIFSCTILQGLVLLIYLRGQGKAVLELLDCILDSSKSSRIVTHSHVASGHRTEFRQCKSAAKRLIFVPFQKVMLTDRGKMVLFFRKIMLFPRRTKYLNISLLSEAYWLYCRYFSTSWKRLWVFITTNHIFDVKDDW